MKLKTTPEERATLRDGGTHARDPRYVASVPSELLQRLLDDLDALALAQAESAPRVIYVERAAVIAHAKNYDFGLYDFIESIERGDHMKEAPERSLFSLIADEMGRARQKFPGNKKMLAALTEEVGEVARALLQRKGREAVRKECVQVAAVACRIFDEGDADFSDEAFKKSDWGDAP